MEFISLIAFGFGMASVFGLIVGVFSVWNGRMTRREIGRLIDKNARATGELLAKMDERAERQSEILREIQASGARQIEILREIQASGARQIEILREVQTSAERIEETQRYVAELVRIEGEKTRSIISH